MRNFAVAVLVLAARIASAEPDTRSENTALLLSLGGTAASVAMIASGEHNHSNGGDSLVTIGVLSTLVTPSFGHWYAGDYLTAGMGIRAASAASMLVGVGQIVSCEGTDHSCDNSAGFFIIGGLIGYGAGALYDIATAPRAARRYNAEHRTFVMPTVLNPPSGPVMGVGIGGSF